MGPSGIKETTNPASNLLARHLFGCGGRALQVLSYMTAGRIPPLFHRVVTPGYADGLPDDAPREGCAPATGRQCGTKEMMQPPSISTCISSLWSSLWLGTCSRQAVQTAPDWSGTRR